MMIENDIFYNIRHLTMSEKVMILNEAYTLHETWWVDILDCNISFTRQKVEMSFEDIMLKFYEKAHFVVNTVKVLSIMAKLGFAHLNRLNIFSG